MFSIPTMHHPPVEFYTSTHFNILQGAMRWEDLLIIVRTPMFNCTNHIVKVMPVRGWGWETLWWRWQIIFLWIFIDMKFSAWRLVMAGHLMREKVKKNLSGVTQILPVSVLPTWLYGFIHLPKPAASDDFSATGVLVWGFLLPEYKNVNNVCYGWRCHSSEEIKPWYTTTNGRVWTAPKHHVFLNLVWYWGLI